MTNPYRSALITLLKLADLAVVTAVFVLVFAVSSLRLVGGQSASPASAPFGDNARLGSTTASAAPAAPASGFEVAPADASSAQKAATSRDTVAGSAAPTDARATTQARGSSQPEPVATSFSDDSSRAPVWLWLIPAALFAAIALGLQWRIRQVR
jgi:cobalamin biosynthesis Mg chelatase CobN